MKQSTGKGRRAWFWIGVILLSVSALWWILLIVSVGDKGDAFLTGVITTVVPIGIGIYGIMRSRKAQAVEVQLGSEPAVKPVQETQHRLGLTKESKSEILMKMPWWFRVVAWGELLVGLTFLIEFLPASLADPNSETLIPAGFGLLFLLLGIWMVGMTTKVTFHTPLGYMTVIRGYCPLFLWFLRIKRISREEARSVFVSSAARMAGSGGATATGYNVMVIMSSGKEVKLYDAGWKKDKAENLAKRILDFAQVAEVELSPGAKFSMRVEEALQATFITGALGMVVGGRVEQGNIQNGDEVEIRGYRGTRRAKVFEVDTLNGSGGQGERVRLLIEDLTEDDVKWGDIVERV